MNTPSLASISSPSSNGLADPDREPMSGKIQAISAGSKPASARQVRTLDALL
jgi:hypothetical protein